MMRTAYYMSFVAGHRRGLDRTGGLPTRLPPEFPRCSNSGEEMAFLAQFSTSPERLDLPSTFCIQLYQCVDVDEGDDPLPVAVRVPIGAPPSREHQGRVHPSVGRFEIEWEARDDPDEIPVGPDPSEEELRLTGSKMGGTPYHDDALEPGATFLIQLREEPAGFNFAGRMCEAHGETSWGRVGSGWQGLPTERRGDIDYSIRICGVSSPRVGKSGPGREVEACRERPHRREECVRPSDSRWHRWDPRRPSLFSAPSTRPIRRLGDCLDRAA